MIVRLLTAGAAAAVLLAGTALAEARSAIPDDGLDAIVDDLTACMLDVGALVFLLSTPEQQAHAGLSEKRISELKRTWKIYSGTLKIATTGVPGWDDAGRRREYDRRRGDYWPAFLAADGSGYKATDEQLAALIRSAQACEAETSDAMSRAYAYSAYRGASVCYVVARPVYDEMQRDPNYGTGLGIDATRLYTIAKGAMTEVETQARRLDMPLPEVHEVLEARYRAFWYPQAGGASPTIDGVASILLGCEADQEFRDTASWATELVDVPIPDELKRGEMQ